MKTKRTLKSKLDVPRTVGIDRRKRGKISLPFKEMIRAVSKLGDQVSELDEDGEWRSNNSLWSQVAADLASKLSITNTPEIRKYIYTAWNRKSANLRSQFINDTLNNNMSTNLQQLSSIPSFTKISTRSKKAIQPNINVQINKSQEHLIEFSYEQWRAVSFIS
jgi:hypothetical protein